MILTDFPHILFRMMDRSLLYLFIYYILLHKNWKSGSINTPEYVLGEKVTAFVLLAHTYKLWCENSLYHQCHQDKYNHEIFLLSKGVIQQLNMSYVYQIITRLEHISNSLLIKKKLGVGFCKWQFWNITIIAFTISSHSAYRKCIA